MERIQSDAGVIRNNYSKRLVLDVLDKTKWNVSFKGPSHQPYNGASFTLQINFPLGYPKEQPVIKFLKNSDQGAPNVYSSLCVKLFQELQWSSSLGICHICLHLQRLMEADLDGVYISNDSTESS